MATVREIEPSKTEEFAERMTAILNSGGLALLTSIGHQAGLFDVMANLPPATSAEIAQAAGLQERYVREWLGGMVTGRIVEYDTDRRLYRLPPEHAGSLTRAAGGNNLAMLAQYIALLGEVEQQLVDCFRRGGGVPYSSYPRFQRLQAEESAQNHNAALLDTTLPLVEGLVDRLRAGIDVADVGCGHGHAINLMAQAFPRSRFVGYDLSQEGVEAGRREAREMGLSNARFEVKDIAALDEPARYDFITAFDAIHDQASPAGVLSNIARALRADGIFLMVDIKGSSELHENLDHPFAPILYTVSCMHCMTVSLAMNGAGLGAMWGRQKAKELLAGAGFADVQVREIDGDFMNYYYIATK